ncbi:hypothetical protein HMPREF1987_01604 [Peptostreptococcaceae bacterium oral taxon 113 str. W5053]|nr:hypothetical protein HMPREF1987_01604 [Peptostreptococcaceae bacterium oral taxon 113 str. W5053]
MLSLHKRIPVGMKNLRWLEAISKGTMKDYVIDFPYQKSF